MSSETDPIVLTKAQLQEFIDAFHQPRMEVNHDSEVIRTLRAELEKRGFVDQRESPKKRSNQNGRSD